MNLLEYTRLVESLREATAGHEVDAEGEPLSLAHLRDLEYQVSMRTFIDRAEMLFVMHPAQFYELRGDVYGAVQWYGKALERHEVQAAAGGTLVSVNGIPTLMDPGLPPAVVYLLDPSALTLRGDVIYPERVGRLTSLAHPDAVEHDQPA